MPTQPTSLAEAIQQVVGKPKYVDINDDGHCRFKYSYPFNLDLALKVKRILDTYPEYYVKEFFPDYLQRSGKGEGKRFAVIKFAWQPFIIPYPYNDKPKHQTTQTIQHEVLQQAQI